MLTGWTKLAVLGALPFLFLLPAGCGDGGNSHRGPSAPSPVTALAESEGPAETGLNDTFQTAELLFSSRVGSGSLAVAGDIDFWSFTAQADQVIRIRLLAARLDQAAWSDTANGSLNPNIPRLTLYDTDGTTPIYNHDYSFLWSWDQHDLDMPMVRIPAGGTYYLALARDNPAQAGGAYSVMVETVDTGPLQFESEPPAISGQNDTFAAAQPILPGVLHGYHVDDESDYYSFTLAAEAVATFEMTAYRNGVYRGDDDYYDPLIQLYGTDGTTLLKDNDDSFFNDSGLTLLLPAGTYYLEAGEFSANTGDGEYFLSYSVHPAMPFAETEPNDDSVSATPVAYGELVSGHLADPGPVPADNIDWFSFTGEAGDMVRINAYDLDTSLFAWDSITVRLFESDGTTALVVDTPGLGDSFQAYRIILQHPGTFLIKVTSSFATDYHLGVERVKAAGYEAETAGANDNDGISTAEPFDPVGAVAGVIDSSGDTDTFSFAAAAGEVVFFSAFADQTGLDPIYPFTGHGSILKPLLKILDGSGTPLAETTYTASVTGESVVDGLATLGCAFVAPAAGTYYLQVTDEGGAGSSTAYYLIEKD